MELDSRLPNTTLDHVPSSGVKLSLGREMGHPSVPGIMVVIHRLSRRGLGHLGVGWGDLRMAVQLSATSFPTCLFSCVSTSGGGDVNDGPFVYTFRIPLSRFTPALNTLPSAILLKSDGRPPHSFHKLEQLIIDRVVHREVEISKFGAQVGRKSVRKCCDQ